MKAAILREGAIRDGRGRSNPLSGGMHRAVARIRTTISKYIIVENDAILSDPNWPYLWKHKR